MASVPWRCGQSWTYGAAPVRGSGSPPVDEVGCGVEQLDIGSLLDDI